MMQSAVASARRVVVKVGSALVTNDGRGLDREAIEKWATQISALQHDGKQVILVSSGAVAEGVLRLGWEKRPSRICEVQAAAAVAEIFRETETAAVSGLSPEELEQLKGLLDRLWRSMETHRMQHDSGEEKNEIQ